MSGQTGIGGSLSFAAFADAYLAIVRSLDADDKASIATALLRAIEREADLVAVARWLSRDRMSSRRPTIASSLPVRVYAELSGEQIMEDGSLDQELFLASRSMSGSSLETIRMLLEARRRAGLHPLVQSEELDVTQVARAVEEISAMTRTPSKVEALLALWRGMSTAEITALHMVFGRTAVSGELAGDVLAAAIAHAFEQPVPLVRHALAIDGDAGRTALSARRGALDATFVRPMQLIAPMHAVPIERIIDDSGAVRLTRVVDVASHAYVIEERLPGVRAQLHVWASELDDDADVVALLVASGRDVSSALPILSARLSRVPAGTVLDGHVIAHDSEGILVGTDALERAASRRHSFETSDSGALYAAFDVLVHGGVSLLEHSYDSRRWTLEGIAAGAQLPITRVRAVHDHDDFERAYVETLARGGLGVIAKRRDSMYEFGRRTAAWLKAPGEPETLLAVIRYASLGLEGRDGPPDELTFGVWLAGDDEARLVNIGRVTCGLDDDELARLTERLRSLRGKRFGSSYEIDPRIVCEIEYDAIRVSPRTDAGYTIRIGCVRCIRWDLDPSHAASVDEIERRHRLRGLSATLESAIYVPGS